MKYIIFVIQLSLSIFLSIFAMGLLTIHVVDHINSYLFIIIQLALVYFFMKASAKGMRKLGWPTVNIKGM